MDEKIYKMLIKAIDHASQAVFLFDKREKNPFFANKQALSYFADENGLIDVYDIFEKEASPFLHSSVTDHLNEKGYAMVYDVPVIPEKGGSEICDVQVAYADDDCTCIMVELYFKPDNRMDVAHSQVNQSSRPEAILAFDDNLTVLHCNDLFHSLFEANEEIGVSHFQGTLSNGFFPETRSELLAEIRERLKSSLSYFTRTQIVTATGKVVWCSMELHRRKLDQSGVDKILVYLVDIDDQIERELEFDEINQYFSILQTMCKGILYRFDINTRTLYRNEGATKEYNVPNKTENFPSKEWLDQIIHPDDVEETIAYGNTLVKGEECSFMVRMLVPNGTFEFHKFTFKPVHRSDGTVKEMIGCTNNIHNFTEAKKELENVNLYFSAFQELSDDMLYHVDIKTKTMYRTSEQANLLGVNAVMPNYPESLATSGVIHPEDVKIYLSYGESLLSGRASQAEIRMKLPEGGYAYRRLSCTPVRDRDGNIVKMFGRVVNVQKVRELEEQANYDALTNILNKRAVFEMVTKVIAESTPSSKHALFFMDLDDFKYVNDHLGHGFGDYLLSELGKRLSENIRQNDFAGRVGGDEFIVFLRDVPSVEMLMGKAKMMLSTISEDFVDGDLRHNIHGSIGVSVFPDHGVSYEELYNHADLALYSSKHKGKNLVTLYEPSMNKT